MTGDMMSSLIFKANPNEVTILFSSKTEEDKASYVSGKRPFMFLTSSELKAAYKLYDAAFTEAASKI
jgi:hypothetical protein